MRNRKPFAAYLFVLAVTAAVGGLLVWNRPAVADQKVTARLLVASHRPETRFTTGESEGVGAEDYRRYQATQISLIKSQSVLKTALQDKNVSNYRLVKNHKDPIIWLQENLKVECIAGSEVMEISLSGDDGQELAGLVNAVKNAYIDVVVTVDAKRRADRYAQLKKLKATYGEALKERRNALRELAESVGSTEDRAGETKTLPDLYQQLRAQRIQLRLDRAEAEALLARRMKSAAQEKDHGRKEIGQLEDRLAVLSSKQKVLDEELERVINEMRSGTSQMLDRKAQKDEIAQMEDATRKIADEVAALSVEMQGPPRFRTIDDAIPSSR